MRNTFEESFGLAYSYTTQLESMSSIPKLKSTTPEKFILGSFFVQSFLKGTIFMSYFSMQLIAPQFKLVSDHEIKTITGYSPAPITDFGIGEPCLYELKHGIRLLFAVSAKYYNYFEISKYNILL